MSRTESFTADGTVAAHFRDVPEDDEDEEDNDKKHEEDEEDDESGGDEGYSE